MIPLEVLFDLPPKIVMGLKNGTYERVGGIIRYAGNKRIVAWLRELPGKNLIPSVVQLGNIGAAASILNLGVSVMGFIVILDKLNHLEKELKKTQQLLEKMNRKIDLGYYANFRAALDLAFNASRMAQTKNRHAMAIESINRFLEAEHIYLGYVDEELKLKSKLIQNYLYTLMLAYVAEAQCYIEIGEIESAQECLQKAVTQITPRIQQYLKILLTFNPAAYLHPQYKDKISWRDLTRLYHYIDPNLDENALFDKLRDKIFSLSRDQSIESGYEWSNKLPSAIVSSEEVPGSIFGNREEMKVEAMKRLPGVFKAMESMVESHQRFSSYHLHLETKTLKQLGMSFQEWKQLTPQNSGGSINASIMYIIPAEPIEIL